jgi:hypothetical protein
MKWLCRCFFTVATAVAGHGAEFQVNETAIGLQITAGDDKLTLLVTDTGKRLTVEAHGRQATHESKGQAPLHLPIVSRREMADLNAFLLDARVSSVLKRWGITVRPQAKPRTADTPSHACTFAESLSAMGTSCCEMPAAIPGVVEQYVCTGDKETYGFVDRICTKPMDANNPCGAAGPNGCAVCWTALYSNSCRTAADPNDANRCAYELR